MQWDDSPNAGFSSAPAEKLYIPLDPSPDRPTAAAQAADETSLRSEIKRLIAIRQQHRSLQSVGGIEFISDGAPGKPLAYIRSLENERILVVINPTAAPAKLAVEDEPEVIYSFGSFEIKSESMTVGECSVVFLKLNTSL